MRSAQGHNQAARISDVPLRTSDRTRRRDQTRVSPKTAPSWVNRAGERDDGRRTAAHTAPTADAGPDRTVKAGSTVTLSGTGTDADGDPLRYRWTQTGGSPTVSLTNADTATTTFKAPALPKGTASLVLTFLLTVTDDEGAAGTDSVVVKVARR